MDLSYIARGGILIWPLFIFGMIALAIFLDRIIYFSFSYISFPNLENIPDFKKNTKKNNIFNYENILNHLFAKDIRSNQNYLSKISQYFLPNWEFRLKNSPYYRIAKIYMEYASSPNKKGETILSGIKHSGNMLITQMENRIQGLQIIATVAPLLGILGTIFGMVETFQVIESSGGQANIAQLAGGIWQAMLTTALGLILSILSHLMHSFLQRILNSRILHMNGMLQYLIENYPKIKSV